MMVSSKVLLLVLALACLSAKADDPSSRIKSISQTVKIFENLTQYPVHHIGLENTTYWYAACGKPFFWDRNCSLTFDTVLFDSNSPPSDDPPPESATRKTCNFELTFESQDSQIAPHMQVLRFGSDKFLVAYVDYNPTSSRQVKHFDGNYQRVGTYIKFITIHTSNCESYMSQTVGTSSKLTSKLGSLDFEDIYTIYLQEDTFEVAYKCNDKVWTQEAFNDKGESLGSPTRVEDSRLSEGSVTMAPGWTQEMPRLGCFDLWPQERYKVSRGLYGADVPFDLLEENVTILKGWSTANGNLSFCESFIGSRNSKTWSCKQGEDEAGQPTMFNVTFEYEPRASIIYNMPGGGLLTVTSGLIAQGEETKETYSLILKKFDAEGKTSRSEEFARVECDGEPSSYLGHFFRDDVGNFCFSLLRANGRFYAKCYPEELFNVTAE